MDFSNYKDNYRETINDAISFIGQDLNFFIEIKADIIIKISEKYCGNTRKLDLLDVGCGVGLTDHYLVPKFQAVYGVDSENELISKAQSLNKAAIYKVCDGTFLPFSDNTFNLVFAINVLHHVKPNNWLNFIKELERVTKPNGIIMIFEHNPFNLLTRYAVKRCAFDADAILLRKKQTNLLFKAQTLKIVEQYYFLFIPLKGTFFRKLEYTLKWLPLGAQYFVVGQKTK